MPTTRRRFHTSLGTYIDYDAEPFIGLTDLVSNVVFLPDISPLRRLQELSEGRLSLEYLSGILHESAHHACLDSPVGLALSSLWQSAQSLWMYQTNATSPQQAGRDLVTAQVAHTLFQPLLEGLALFCEHDMITGDSPIVSRVTQRAAPLFTKGLITSLLPHSQILEMLVSAGPEGAFSAAHCLMLRQSRKSDAAAENKALLLEQPIHGSHRYLLGYLAVKGMHAALTSRCHFLFDPELFFVTVVSHFMHDEQLADILLRFRNDSDDEVANFVTLGLDVSDFLTRFQDLCDELYTKTTEITDAAVKRFAQIFEPELSQSQTSKQILMGFRTVGTINIAWPRLMKHRQDFRFSFQQVVVHLREDGQASVRNIHSNEVICEVTAVEGCRPADWPQGHEVIEVNASIEAVHLRDLKTVVVCILGHTELIAVVNCESGVWNEPQLVELLGDMPSASAIEGAMHAFAHWQNYLQEHTGVRDALNHYKEQSLEGVDLLYPQLACHGWKIDQRTKFMAALREQGFLSVFDSQDFSRFSRLSLLAGVGTNIDGICSATEMQRDKLLHEIDYLNRRCESVTGFKPFVYGDTTIHSRV